MLAAYRHVPHLREEFGNIVRWLWVLSYVSAFNKVGSLFWYRPEFPMMFSGLCPPSTDIRGSHLLGGEAFEYAHPPARSSRTWLSLRNERGHHREDHFLLSVGIYFLAQLTVVASVMLRILLVFRVRLFQPFPLRDGSFYFGTAPWYFLSRYTSGFPEMLISHSPNGLIVFRHVLLTYPYRPAGESLVLQTWHMSKPFAPDPLDKEDCESARGDSGRAPARHLADDPSARKQFRPVRPPQRVRWWYGHGEKGPSGTFRHRSVLHGG